MLQYMSLDPIYRAFNHDKLTFSFFYCFSENYILPISHDEVVHGKCSMHEKMPGSYEQKCSSYKAFLTYMMAHPGKKLLFMGQEFAQTCEWNYESQLDWDALEDEGHKIFIYFRKSLINFILKMAPLWQNDDHGQDSAGSQMTITSKALLHSDVLTITEMKLLLYVILFRLKDLTIKSAFLMRANINCFLTRTLLNSAEAV